MSQEHQAEAALEGVDMTSIRPYRPDDDEAGVFDLWQTGLGGSWPLTRDIFRRVTVETDVYRAGDHFVAEENGVPVGFVTTQAVGGASSARTGHIGALLVAPTHRRRGIGRALHDAALRHLREVGVQRAQLGGGDTYLWPGVPSTLPSALAFFNSCGWAYTETSYDLVQEARDFAPPPAVYQRTAARGIALEIGTPATAAQVLAFVAQNFPSWDAAYRSVATLGDYADILFARADDGPVIGAVSMYSPLSHSQRLDVRWKTLLGADVGAIGAVGVAALARRRGVGHALVARASEIVRDRGARRCFIGWAWMIGLYGELGYRVWQEYRMSRREIS
jgi:ribosomal protein S18 acetylase RimI-like enzyme